ncbi:MAG: FG-GAP repeat protein [Deltaproteobacteria bacterium]|jgi:hypothetical protein|nr:FG-GAP repeat protein [Deltaproteobacteria bacterium]
MTDRAPLRPLPCAALLIGLGAGCYSPTPPPADSGAQGGASPVDRDGDGAPADEDCDDADASLRPGAVEICDGLDNDCDGLIDDADTNINRFTQLRLYADVDGDGFGAGRSVGYACLAPAGQAANDADCDDADPSAHPRHAEVCDGVDNDCDTLVDDADPSVDLRTARDWFTDRDDDGFGAPGTAALACAPPSRSADNDLDCDDADALSHPGAPELCDGRDNDCDGALDLASPGLGSCPAAVATHLVEGGEAGDHVGAALSWVGDMTGDGLPDLGVGAPGVDGRGAESGVVAIIPGPPPPSASAARAPLRVVGAGPGDQLGPLRGLGDMNGDGFDDLAVQAPGHDGGNGLLAVVYGPMSVAERVDALPARVVGLGAGAGRALPMSGPGDVDGDGLAELLVADPAADRGARGGGVVWLFGGPVSSRQTRTDARAELWGAAPGLGLGALPAPGPDRSASDLNGDGLADLVLGAPGDGVEAAEGGAVFVLLGPVDGKYDVADADLVLRGGVEAGRAGAALALPGDVDGDGGADLVVGVPGAEAGRGRALLLTAPLSRAGLGGATASLRGRSPGLGLGAEVGGPGDLDGDGRAELTAVSLGWGEGAGALWLWAGPVDGAHEVDEAAPTLFGEAAGAQVGAAQAGVGDLDGDGRGELLLGAPGLPDRRGEELEIGVAYLFFGRDL